MARPQHIDRILRSWQYEPEAVSVRIVKGDDSREVIQMRVDMGLLQLETSGRPDGERPEGYDTYFDCLASEALSSPEAMELTEEQCAEADREFVQFYHRRICWLALRRYELAVRDADHTLAFMDFCRRHSSDEQWTLSHEQYRPFVLFHRTQAAALAALEEDGAETAISAINDGLDRLRNVFSDYEAEEHFEDDDLVGRLTQLREALRDEYAVGRTLQEQLDDAVAAEQYEQAASLRDEIERRNVERN